tara:strand:- start:670 stop:1194 length:525 start_codon:yes stop_codon:yes gene_type:complete
METPSSSNFSLVHEIFILDAHLTYVLDQSKAVETTKKLVNALLTILRMEELGDLQIYNGLDPRAPGWSFIQPITTSHISGHYFEKPGRLPHIRMDFYSCSRVHWKKIIKIVNEHLGMADWRGTFIDRQIEPGATRHSLDIAGKGDMIVHEVPLGTHDTLSRATEAKKEEVKAAA